MTAPTITYTPEQRIAELERELAGARKELAAARAQLAECQKTTAKLSARNRELLLDKRDTETIMRAPNDRIKPQTKLVVWAQLGHIRKAQKRGDVRPDGGVMVPTWEISRQLGGVHRNTVGREIKKLDEDIHLWKQAARWDYAPWDKGKDGEPVIGAEKTQFSYVTPDDGVVANLSKLGTDESTPKRNHGGIRTCKHCGSHNLVTVCADCGARLEPKDIITVYPDPEDRIEPDELEPVAASAMEETAEPEPAGEPDELEPLQDELTAPEPECPASDTGYHEYFRLRTVDGRRICVVCDQPEERGVAI